MYCSDVGEPCNNHYYEVTEEEYECSQYIKTQPSTKVIKQIYFSLYTLKLYFYKVLEFFCFALLFLHLRTVCFISIY